MLSIKKDNLGSLKLIDLLRIKGDQLGLYNTDRCYCNEIRSNGQKINVGDFIRGLKRHVIDGNDNKLDSNNVINNCYKNMCISNGTIIHIDNNDIDNNDLYISLNRTSYTN